MTQLRTTNYHEPPSHVRRAEFRIVPISPYESMSQPYDHVRVWLWSPFGEEGMISKNSITHYVVAAFCWDLGNLQSFSTSRWWRIDLLVGWNCHQCVRVFVFFHLMVSNMSFLFTRFISFPQFLEHFQCPSIGLSKANLRFLDIAMACYWLLRILKGHEVMPDVGHSSKHKFLDHVFLTGLKASEIFELPYL